MKDAIAGEIQFPQGASRFLNSNFGPAMVEFNQELVRVNSGRKHIVEHRVFGALDIHF